MYVFVVCLVAAPAAPAVPIYVQLINHPALPAHPTQQQRDTFKVYEAHNAAVRDAAGQNPPVQIRIENRAAKYADRRLRITAQTGKTHEWKAGELDRLERELKYTAQEAYRDRERAKGAEAARVRKQHYGKRSVASRKRRGEEGRSPHIKTAKPVGEDVLVINYQGR